MARSKLLAQVPPAFALERLDDADLTPVEAGPHGSTLGASRPASLSALDGTETAPDRNVLAANEVPASRERIDSGARSPSINVELKLWVDPGQLAQLIDSPPIVAHARNKGTVRHFKDVYYDTPAGALLRAGVMLRVRRRGGRFIQTVKIAPADGGIPLRRSEWEFPVAGMAPDFQAMMPLMSAGLQNVLAHDPLLPMFGAELRRRVRTLVLPSGTVEIAFDTGIVRSGERSAPICEIELKRGSAAALYDFALRLAEHAAIRPVIRSKVERGFELASATAPGVHPARRLETSRDVSVDDAFAQLLQSALYQLLLNQPAAEDGKNA